MARRDVLRFRANYLSVPFHTTCRRWPTVAVRGISDVAIGTTITPSLAKTVVPYLGFRQQLRNPSDDMPAYAEAVISEKDLADIYAFLEALPGRCDVKDFTDPQRLSRDITSRLHPVTL